MKETHGIDCFRMANTMFKITLQCNGITTLNIIGEFKCLVGSHL